MESALLFQGKSIRASAPDAEGVIEVCFFRQGEAINKFDERTVGELREVTALLATHPALRGVLVTSAKDVFIVGADITEFGDKFNKSAAAIAEDVARSNEVFNAFEDLPVPSVVAINGYALGGGMEFTLACALRVMGNAAQVGVPEVKLGLFPGFGGTVRLVRVVGPAVACDWVASGKPAKADAALAAGAVDVVAEPESLRETARQTLQSAIAGEIDWRARQQAKRSPIAANSEAFATARAKVAKASPPNQPAAITAIDMMEAGASLDRAGALRLENLAFGQVARSQAAVAMVQTFLNEQAVKKIAKRAAQDAAPVRQVLVLGAGIMGGGIAFASALKGVPARMKDLRTEALEQGTSEARKQVARLTRSGRLSEARGAEVLAAITPQLDDSGIGEADLVVEAIVENLDIKRQVLAALEPSLREDAVLATNTSSLRIDDIAAPLVHPERLVGMHFFNPVPLMPLVEIVRGSRTSPAAVATAVAYAGTMGKTAIVVGDCPGFLVNRVLTAYMRGFLQLVSDGADFAQVDQVMEAFGWPMGPAYLEDVVGIDTGSHVNDVISAGYPDRMPAFADDALRLMKRLGRFGQKNGLGFYRYETSETGKPRRVPAEDTHALLAALQPNGTRHFSTDQIVDRMMLPMVLEAARALDEGVAGSAAEVDLAMQLGLGFPGYAGGPLKYADWLGLAEVVARCDRLRELGPAYEVPTRLRAMASAGQTFH
jgi:3-hydroxyacyl-CoA dehydrogenase/enoyl-CoA hydratase/3-hydroxybutyryl-CoA epimerase/enoyl-CoA isomerase